MHYYESNAPTEAESFHAVDILSRYDGRGKGEIVPVTRAPDVSEKIIYACLCLAALNSALRRFDETITSAPYRVSLSEYSYKGASSFSTSVVTSLSTASLLAAMHPSFPSY